MKGKKNDSDWLRKKSLGQVISWGECQRESWPASCCKNESATGEESNRDINTLVQQAPPSAINPSIYKDLCMIKT